MSCVLTASLGILWGATVLLALVRNVTVMAILTPMPWPTVTAQLESVSSAFTTQEGSIVTSVCQVRSEVWILILKCCVLSSILPLSCIGAMRGFLGSSDG